jgi:prolipoprotein diacylglyceryltransferase
MGGCAYGAVGQGFGHAILPDLFGLEAPRFATQVVGLAFSLVLFVAVWLLRGRWPFPGASFLMYLLIYCGGQFFLEFTRGDEAIYLGPWRLAQWLDLVLALASAGGLLFLWWRARGEDVGDEETELLEETERLVSPEEAGVLEQTEEFEEAEAPVEGQGGEEVTEDGLSR